MNKRLRQYRKIWDYCHKKVWSGQINSDSEHETILSIQNRAAVAVLNMIGDIYKDKLPIIGCMAFYDFKFKRKEINMKIIEMSNLSDVEVTTSLV